MTLSILTILKNPEILSRKRTIKLNREGRKGHEGILINRERRERTRKTKTKIKSIRLFRSLSRFSWL
jgi:hypothetical protein